MFHMPLRVHDTRRREKVPFKTMEPGKVSMYVCGSDSVQTIVMLDMLGAILHLI